MRVHSIISAKKHQIMSNMELANYLHNTFKHLSFSQQDGRMFADKSYGFDTMFFCARFIIRFSKGTLFEKSNLSKKSNNYIEDIFSIEGKKTGVPNYMNEATSLLNFEGALKPASTRGLYNIENKNILYIYSSSIENAYITQYMLAYSVFVKDGIWPLYESFVNAKNLADKEQRFQNIVKKIEQVAPTLGNWARSVAKFSVNILSYANRDNMVARTGNVKSKLVERKDIACNVKGTRSGSHAVKKNSYLEDLSDSYILSKIAPYLVRKANISGEIELSDGFAADLADTKMDMLDKDNSTEEGKKHIKNNKYSLALAKIRTVQDEFKKSLLRATPHKCPVCGFDFEKMLTASHIIPYSKCEMTEDAMNPNNGLLMCPVCDRLFESENGLYMTIDSRTGHIRYVDEIHDVKWFKYIQGVRIDEEYLTKDRKMFLKWHNETFISKHKDDIIHDSVGTTLQPKTYDLPLNGDISMVADGNADRDNENDE